MKQKTKKDTTPKKEFEIKYLFNGNGRAVVKAKNQKEAEDMFFDGRFGGIYGPDKDWGEEFEINQITELKT